MSKQKQPPTSVESVAKKAKIAPTVRPSVPIVTSAAITSTSATTSSSTSIPNDPIEARFVALCEANPEGVSEAQLNREFTDITLHELGAIINKILKQQRLKVYATETGQMIYKLVNSADAEKFRGLNAEDMLIYQLIEQSGNIGIWIRDIRKRANMQAPKLNKTIKLLLTKKLIKSEKSIAGKNKKVYMLYHLEPSKEVTGGAFYTGHEFDTAFTDELYKACLKCFKAQGKGSVEGVTDYVHKLGIFKVNISSTDIAAILSSMSYDGVIERMGDPAGEPYDRKKVKLSNVWYKLCRAGPLVSGYTYIPCSVCPVADKCIDGGLVSPQTCVYIKQWCDF